MMELDLIINSKKRYEQFIKRVTKNKIVWGLAFQEGWCVCESNEYEDIIVMPFWSDKAYAKQCAFLEWSKYIPTPIPLEEFMTSWINGMQEDGLLVGVNWNAKLIGLEVAPVDLLNDLEETLNK